MVWKPVTFLPIKYHIPLTLPGTNCSDLRAVLRVAYYPIAIKVIDRTSCERQPIGLTEVVGFAVTWQPVVPWLGHHICEIALDR